MRPRSRCPLAALLATTSLLVPLLLLAPPGGVESLCRPDSKIAVPLPHRQTWNLLSVSLRPPTLDHRIRHSQRPSILWLRCVPTQRSASVTSSSPEASWNSSTLTVSEGMWNESRQLRSPPCNDHDTNADVEQHQEQLAVTLLQQTDQYVVVSKPPSVVCHHSDWTGSKARNEIPMLQRIRTTLNRPVNFIHRLDRGCSGALLVTLADTIHSTNTTREFNHAFQHSHSIKTYFALVRGEGILHGRNFTQEGWFVVDRPIKDERGILQNATTWFRFVAGQDNANITINRPRASIVLARPTTGRWHQIRKHLNGLSHPIIGDSTHGNSKENRYWRQRYDLLPERTCLHLARMQVVPTSTVPQGIDVSCPLAPDMKYMLEQHLPKLLEEARPIVQEECGMVL